MFLKSVEIFGFKSFADKVRIEFTDGITALLGPNGCGKSNVVDAIKWVLGEQSTRTLRAEKMEDVIFNGTESRKALNIAEVTLTISNDNEILPLEISEIAIKRRLYRSGDSEYFINNTPAKLREIREVFFDTGVGKSAYSIMEQGKIDQVLSNKPEERRYLFEEAATITKYRMKGQEAERKLTKTEENMRQIDGILTEVKRSHDSLKKQSEKTVVYRTFTNEAFELEINLQLLRLREIISRKDERDVLLKSLTDKRNSEKAVIDGINESLEENLDEVNTLESKLIEMQKKLYGLELEKTNASSQLKLLANQLGEIDGKISSEQMRQESFEKQLKALEVEKNDYQKVLHEIEQRIEGIEKNIAEFEESIVLTSERVKVNNDTIEKEENEIERQEELRSQYQKDLQKLTDDIVQELDEGLKNTGFTLKERKELQQRIAKQLEGLFIYIEGRKNILTDSLRLNDMKRTESVVLEALNELINRSDTLRKDFAEYQKTEPRFLEDFLAPEGIITRKRELESKIQSTFDRVKEARNVIEKCRKENADLNKKIDEYRSTLGDLKVNLAREKAQATASKDSIAKVERDFKSQQKMLEENKLEIERSKKRKLSIEEEIVKIEASRKETADEEKKLQNDLLSLEKGISEKNKNLQSSEKELKKKMESLGLTQTRLEKVQVECAELATQIKGIHSNFEDQYSRNLLEFEDRMHEIDDTPKNLREKLSDKKKEIKNLGHVNLMAPEEYAEVKERYDFLNNQLADLKKAREDLERVTKEIRTESAEMFVQTYDKIKKNFHTMFRRLFGGGRAELRLTDPENVLESGIEIFAQPPGKKLENIALLSGGERSLTAVALLFATYMVKPSPFCLLDEIDAALDESNVGRFINMLVEFAESSQFIVITHNKKTVTGARTLLGVTMEESGVSKVVSIRLDEEPVAEHAR